MECSQIYFLFYNKHFFNEIFVIINGFNKLSLCYCHEMLKVLSVDFNDWNPVIKSEILEGKIFS